MPNEIEAVEELSTVGEAVDDSEAGEESLGTPSAATAETTESDRAALETTLTSLLGNAFDGKDEDEPAEEPAEEVVAEVEETDEPGEEEVTDETEGTEVEGAAAEQEVTPTPVEVDPNAPTLPAAYIRTLKAYDWTDDEIAQNLKVLGGKFVETAAKLHLNRNKESSQWAETGRQAKAASLQQQAQQPTPVTLAPVSLIDTAALKAKYADDALIDAIAGPMNAQAAQINAILPLVRQMQAKTDSNVQETAIREINGFFSGKELKPYVKLYGTEKTLATDTAAQTARNKVLERAEWLILGAEKYGKTLTLGEALLEAHDNVSSGYKTQAVRTTIKNQLVKRSKGISLRPSSRASTPTASGTNDKRKLEGKLDGLLTKAFV